MSFGTIEINLVEGHIQSKDMFLSLSHHPWCPDTIQEVLLDTTYSPYLSRGIFKTIYSGGGAIIIPFKPP